MVTPILRSNNIYCVKVSSTDQGPNLVHVVLDNPGRVSSQSSDDKCCVSDTTVRFCLQSGSDATSKKEDTTSFTFKISIT